MTSLPGSALGKAMTYTRKQWLKLITYTEDGRLRMDNNLTELPQANSLEEIEALLPIVTNSEECDAA